MTALEFVLFSTIVVTCVQRMPLVVGDCEQRTVHNAAIGVITDGDDDHKEKVVCEWLINGESILGTVAFGCLAIRGSSRRLERCFN